MLTTASLAVNPVISAVEIRQSLKPKGMNTGAIKRPISASILWALESTTLNRVSKVCKNQMTKVAQKNNGKGLYNKVLCLVINQPQNAFGTGEAIVGQLHDKGNRLAFKQGCA